MSYALTVTVSDGPANDVVVTDLLPDGLDAPRAISDGGTYDAASRTISWQLGALATGSYELTYQAAVGADVGPDGGTFADGVITWELGTLSASGSVSFVTTVDPDAPEAQPIVNAATIVSDQTPADDGSDSVVVTSESELGGGSTPAPRCRTRRWP